MLSLVLIVSSGSSPFIRGAHEAYTCQSLASQHLDPPVYNFPSCGPFHKIAKTVHEEYCSGNKETVTLKGLIQPSLNTEHVSVRRG